MEKLSEEKPDDLEITSIGSLYRGNWDKKYWSSSRGKDRYPYPVGYQAIRTHTGNTYRMEICEGLKGPLFMVTSDGDSCTGQTPDIAWENFQKKSCLRVKNWHGKRLSSKIDGVELFGFKNPFVQRLLRELVANVDGVAERSLVVPTFCNGATKVDQERSEQSHAYPNLVPFLGKQQIIGKRSLKNRSSSIDLIEEARVKKLCCEVTSKNPEFKNSSLEGVFCSSSKDRFPTQVTSYPPRNSLGAGAATINNVNLELESPRHGESVGCATSIKSCHRNEDLGGLLKTEAATIGEENCQPSLAANEILMESKNSEHSFEKPLYCHEQNTDACDDNLVVTCAGKTLEKSFDAELKKGDPSRSPTNSDGEHVALAACQDVSLPDKSDATKDTVGSPLQSNMGNCCSLKNELVEPALGVSVSSVSEVSLKIMPQDLASAENHDISKSTDPLPEELHVTNTLADTFPRGLVKDSLSELGSSSGSPNPSSGNVDLELAGQELARSMMTFLLPRAVPLLTKTYVKRRSRRRLRENRNYPCSTSSVPKSAEHTKTEHLNDTRHQGDVTAKLILQAPGMSSQEKLNPPQLLLGGGSQCQITRDEPLPTGCMAVGAFSASGSSKDAKSIIPDSFEDDLSVHGLGVTKPSPCSGQADIAHFNGVKENLNSSLLHGNDSERRFFNSQNDLCNVQIPPTDAHENDENLLSDSLLDYVDPDKCISLKQVRDDECTYETEKVSNWNPNYLGSNTDNKSPVDPHAIIESSQPFTSEYANHMEVEIPNHKSLLVHGLARSDKVENSEQGCPCPSINGLADNVSKINMIPSSSICFTDNNHSHCSNGQDNFDVNISADSKDANVRDREFASHITMVEHDKREDLMLQDDSCYCMPNVLSSRDLQLDVEKVDRIHHLPCTHKECHVPLSEIIICRNYKNDNSPKIHFPLKASDAGDTDRTRHPNCNIDIAMPVIKEVSHDNQPNQLFTEENDHKPIHTLLIAASDAPQLKVQHLAKSATEVITPSYFHDSSFASLEKGYVTNVNNLCLHGESYMQPIKKIYSVGVLPCSDMDIPLQNSDSKYHSESSFSKQEHSSMDAEHSMELIGCYLHPNPVLSVLLASNEEFLHIYILCGLVESDTRDLFVYMVSVEGHKGQCPSFHGYTSLLFPLLEGSFCDLSASILVERSGLLIAPNGQYLVFLNTIKAPRCKERNFDCSCTDCKSGVGEENTIEIAHVNRGYVSSVMKLASAEPVSCILVCEPYYLIAAEKSGKLRVWMLNSTWDLNLEEFMLPRFNETLPMIVELKRIPSCDPLIIGHNGLGGFALWDISKRALLAKFASPGTRIFHIIPVENDLFNWESKGSLSCGQMDHMKETTPIRDKWHPKADESSLLSLLKEDIAIWLLVSAASDAEAELQVREGNRTSVGWWRLVLLARNEVVMGSILDPRASALGTLSNCGIYGTFDGFLYKWELFSGEKLATLQPFKCGVLSIATDAKSGVVAVAGNECELLLYKQTRTHQ